MKKECNVCKIKKNINEFHKDKTRPDGYNYKCKTCVKESSCAYRDKHSDIIKQRNKEYESNNKLSIRKRKRKHRRLNKDIYNKKQASYRKNCDGKRLEYERKWEEENKEKRNAQKRERAKIRRKEDLIYRLNDLYGSHLRRTYYKIDVKKKNRREEIRGCSDKYFLDYINNNPYGLIYGDEGIDLDHIIASSSAKTEEDVKRLHHYTNFQLLPSVYNRDIKSDNPWNQTHFEEWLLKNPQNSAL